jgi:hypothetical protein
MSVFVILVCFITGDPTVAFDKVSVPICINDTEFHLCMNVVATIESNRLRELVCNVIESRDSIVNAYYALLMGI